MINHFKSSTIDFFNILKRIRNRDFAGNSGTAIKNSIYQFSMSLSVKLGSFIFTIILARLLLPEVFGLYSLALSTILLFSAFTEMGIGTTLVRYVSKEFAKKNSKIKAHLLYLAKIKITLLLLVSLAIILSARYISDVFYQKPIYLALLAGIFYILAIQLVLFFRSMLEASNYFKGIFKTEVIFQIARIVLVPLAVLFAARYSLSDSTHLMLIIFVLGVCFLISFISLFFDVKKTYLKRITSEVSNILQNRRKTEINKFLLITVSLALSGVFFGNIDRVMLGKFVSAEFIGYYSAAFNLIGALTPLVGFAAVVLLPIFSRLKGKSLEMGFKKSLNITIVFSAIIFVIVLIFSDPITRIAYGAEYLQAVNVLRILSLILLILPLIALHQSYYLSQKGAKTVAKLLAISTLLNILLNYLFITSMLPSGEISAVYGASIATILSQLFYLGGLAISRNKTHKNY